MTTNSDVVDDDATTLHGDAPTIANRASAVADDATTLHEDDADNEVDEKRKKELKAVEATSSVEVNTPVIKSNSASSGIGSKFKKLLRSPAADRASAIMAKRPPETEKDYYINERTGKREKYIKEYYPLMNAGYEGYFVAKEMRGGK